MHADARGCMRRHGLDTLTIGFAIYHLKDPEGAPRYVLIIKQNIYIYLFKKKYYSTSGHWIPNL